MERVEIKVSAFGGSERDSIRAYQRRVPELMATRVVMSAASIRGKLKWESGAGLQTFANLPPEDDLRSFYMAFRFFFLKSEPSYFMRVANIIGRHAQHPLVHSLLDRLRAQWTGALARQQFSIRVNGRALTTELLVDLWFNAHYFHSNPQKEAELNLLNSILSQDLNRYLLADAVFEATKAVGDLYAKTKDLKV